MPSIVIGGYWGPRAQPEDDAAAAAERTLRALAAADPSLARWYETADSAEEALSLAVEPTVERLRELLRENRDDDGDVMESLGRRLTLWNGEEPGASLSVHAGGTSSWVPNNAVLTLPERTPALDAVAERALRALVDIWRPDRGVVIGDELFDMQEDEPGEIDAGWITYLRAAAAPQGLPPAALAEPWPDGVAVHLGRPPEPPQPADVLAVRRALS